MDKPPCGLEVATYKAGTLLDAALNGRVPVDGFQVGPAPTAGFFAVTYALEASAHSVETRTASLDRLHFHTVTNCDDPLYLARLLRSVADDLERRHALRAAPAGRA